MLPPHYKHCPYSNCDSHPNNFYIYSCCAHMHTLSPSFFCVNGKRASWFIYWLVIYENWKAFLYIPCWEEETDMSIDVNDTLSNHTGPSVFIWRSRCSWQRIFITFHPPVKLNGAVFQMGKTWRWDLLKVLTWMEETTLETTFRFQERLVEKWDKMSPEWPAWGLHTCSDGHSSPFPPTHSPKKGEKQTQIQTQGLHRY